LLLAPEEHDVQPLRVFWSAAYEAKKTDCDPPESFEGHETAEQRAASVAAWRKSHAKEYARCVARLEKDAKDDAEELTSDLVLGSTASNSELPLPAPAGRAGVRGPAVTETNPQASAEQRHPEEEPDSARQKSPQSSPASPHLPSPPAWSAHTTRAPAHTSPRPS
jgi:hypothetical protein